MSPSSSSLADFKIFSLFCVFRSWIWYVYLWLGYLSWWFGSLVWWMSLILEFLIIIPSNIYSTPFSVFCFPSGILIANLLGHLILSYSSVFIFTLSFFLSFSWDIFKVTDSFLSSVKFADETANDNLDLYYCFSRVVSSFNFFPYLCWNY